MTPVPLDRLRLFGWEHHKSALWWLALLYRRPHRFRESLEKRSTTALEPPSRAAGFSLRGAQGGLAPIETEDAVRAEAPTSLWGVMWSSLKRVSLGDTIRSRLRQAAAASGLCAHALPYLFLLCVLGRLLVFGVFGVPTKQPTTGFTDALAHHAAVTAFGIAIGIAIGIAFGIGGWIVRGMASGIAGGIAGGIALELAGWIPGGLVRWIAFAFATAAIGIIEGIIYGIAIGIAEGIAFALSFMPCVVRGFYLIPHLAFVWRGLRPNWYPYHPLAWDDLCALPFWRLDRLLVAYAEHSPEAGKGEIKRLVNEYPSQRMAALRAWTILCAGMAAGVTRLTALEGIVAKLPAGEKGFLKQTGEVRGLMEELSRLQTCLDTMERPFLRAPYAEQLVTKIENFRHRIAGFHEPLRTEFRKAAEAWLVIAKRQLAETRRVLEREPTHQPFRAGDPVRRDNEAFVARYGVVGEIEQQVTLATGCPGLILYGRRRTGKSTIQANLGGFLPMSVTTVTLSMQDPQAFTSIDSFVGTLSARVQGAVCDRAPSRDEPSSDAPRGLKPAAPKGGATPRGLKPAARGTDASVRADPKGGPGHNSRARDLTGLYQHLSAGNEQLAADGRSLLIMLDEYEGIDQKIGDGTFTEDLLATLRESIQNHRRIIWMFAGTHEITELRHAPWTSYLVSLRTIEVPMFTPKETHLLLTEPMKYSRLWEKDDPRRPRFEPGFWGDGGIERIHAEAGGWPHLVQLIAETCVDLVNEEGAACVYADLFQRALDKAIVRGHNVLYELLIRECTAEAERDYLMAFQHRESQKPPEDEAVHRSLRRRLLIAEDAGLWHLRVPLMARWLRERG